MEFVSSDVQGRIGSSGCAVRYGRERAHHHELDETLLPNTAEPAGQTPCTQRKKASFRFLLWGCWIMDGNCSIGPTMPSSPKVGNLPLLFGPLREGIFNIGVMKGSGTRSLWLSDMVVSVVSAAWERHRSALRFHSASISAHLSSVRR